MHVWFTMGEDEKGVLTGLRPIVARVCGTHRQGVYAQAGDWLLVRGLCAEGVQRMLGRVPEPNKPMKVDLQVVPVEATVTKA